MAFQAPRGTNDILPADPGRSPKWDRIFEAHRWLFMEAQFRETAALAGFQEIRTPVFEDLDLFKRTSGDSSEVVNKQMYDFVDKGDRTVALKPEATAPVVRACIEHGMLQNLPLRLSYCGSPTFRYERPQRGRYRQSHQMGFEIIGASSPAADAEIIECAVTFFGAMGIESVKVLINSIGRAATRAKYREALLEFLKPLLADMSEEQRATAERNPLRLFDSKDPKMQDALRESPQVLDYLEPESAQHFDLLQHYLADAGIEFEIRPEIVRGLDYYTDTVFEIQSTALGAQSSLCGGGRYDGLVKELGGPPLPAVGVGIGMERTLIVQEALGEVPLPSSPEVFVVASSPEYLVHVKRLTSLLREEGFGAVYDFDAGSMKSQMKAAAKAQAGYAAIIGEEEVEAEKITLRNLESGEQQMLSYEEVFDALLESSIADLPEELMDEFAEVEDDDPLDEAGNLKWRN